MMFPLTVYFEAAMELARNEKLEDGSYAGDIPKLPGVIAFGGTLRECERELRSTVEDWVLVGLRLGHRLPKLNTTSLKHTHRRRAPLRRRREFPSIERLRRSAALRDDGQFITTRCLVGILGRKISAEEWDAV